MKIVLKRIGAIICIMVLFIRVWSGLRYFLTDDTQSYTRVMMHEYYGQSDIDIIFSGASLCYRSFDTVMLDREMRTNTFNLGSSSQDIDASYYLIKDAVKRYNPKEVYLELSPIMALNIDIENRSSNDMTSTYIISDYMKPSILKYKYLLGASKPDCYVNSFLIARRNWKKIDDFEYLKDLASRKNSDIYRDYKTDWLCNNNEQYITKGYVASKVQVGKHSFYDSYVYEGYDVSSIKDDWFNYLIKIISCCKKNNVKLTLVCAPLSNQLIAVDPKGYQEYHNLLENIAIDNNIEFWDFTLIKDNINSCFGMYKDSAHLNMYGAERFNSVFSKIARGGVPSQHYFYKTVDEKIENTEPMLCGISTMGDNRRIIAVHPLEFRVNVIACPKEGEKYLLNINSDNYEFAVPSEESGVIRVEAKLISTGEVQSMEFDY